MISCDNCTRFFRISSALKITNAVKDCFNFDSIPDLGTSRRRRREKEEEEGDIEEKEVEKEYGERDIMTKLDLIGAVGNLKVNNDNM